MKVLAIETSCDETAVAIIEATGDELAAQFSVLGNALLSQIDIHQEYGGVFPALAKREHAKNLVPLLEAALEEAELLHEDTQSIPDDVRTEISKLLEREPGLEQAFFDVLTECEVPDIDAIAVTAGPGLEPALWVGINFARALSVLWQKPIVAVNHMEGHILSALAKKSSDGIYISDTTLPVLALLISGGHTELVSMKEWLSYEIVGQTRDDAVGEAYDKVARMMGLPYPGGPQISKLAEGVRDSGATHAITLPRPMLDSNTCDFSFAGLKTAVLYLLKNNPAADKNHIAHEFENAVAEVLWKKTAQAIDSTGAQTLVIGGGVSANTHIRRTFETMMTDEYSNISLRIPTADLTTDNAIMIALAGFYRALRKDFADPATLKANGNLSLAARP